MLVVMYNTAVRIDALLSLRIRELHLDDSWPHITVVGKGVKVRTLALLPRTVRVLRRHLDEFHGDDPSPSHYVFYSRNGGRCGKLSQMAVNKQLKKYSSIAHDRCPEVPVSMHCHQIRHTAASHWLANGINSICVSVGHYVVELETRGSRRMDIMVFYGRQSYIVELKVWHGQSTANDAYDQLVGYLKSQGHDSGYLLSFCDNRKKPREDRTFDHEGYTITEVIVAYRDSV